MKEVTLTYTAQITHVYRVGDEVAITADSAERARATEKLVKQYLNADDVVVTDMKTFTWEDKHES